MTASLLPGHYDPKLIVLSVTIAIVACYAALILANRTAVSAGKLRHCWMTGGAVALGIGIWSMHYIGMLAFTLPVPVSYDVPTVAWSLLAAITASAIALYSVSRDGFALRHCLFGSVSMGTGIFAMHYIGMAAMRLPATCQYNPFVVALSGLLAVGVSGVALWLSFRLRGNLDQQKRISIATAIIMGFGIAAVHYTAMAGVCFRSMGSLTGHSAHHLAPHSVVISDVAAVSIGILTLLLLGSVVLTSALDRYFRLQRENLLLIERQNSLLTEHNLASVSRTSLDGRVLEGNESFLRILGVSSLAELQDSNIKDFYWDPADRARIVAGLAREGSVHNVEVCLRKRNGTPVWVVYNLALSPALDGSGAKEVIATAVDITPLKQNILELQSAKDQAEQANQAKGQFLTNMSHELRTPLNGILGLTELVLSDPSLSPDSRELLETARGSGMVLLDIVNDILDMSKFNAGQIELQQEPVDLRATVAEVVHTHAPTAGNKHLSLSANIADEVPARILTDRGRFHQLLNNLVGNAVKFTDRGGVRLAIELETTGANEGNGTERRLHITVADTGIGIAQTRLQSIFAAFTQADESNTRAFGGTGLGLTICAKLVEAMGGRIWAESTPGQGSIFHVTAPFKVLAYTEQPTNPQPALAVSS